MSTSATAVVLTLSAVLGAGWVKTFSEGAASMNMLSAAGKAVDENLTRIGARKTPLFDNLADSEEKLERARRELEKYQARLKDKTPTEAQTRETARLTAAVETAQRARDKDKRKLDEWKNKLREANVDVEKTTSLLSSRRKLSGLSDAIGEISQKLSGVSAVFKNAFYSVSGYIGALTSATANVSDWGDTMAKTAQRLNMFDAAGTENVEQLQRMQWAALQANIEGETFVKYLDDMTRRLAQAAEGSGEAANAYARLGLSAKALSQMGADKQFELILDAFGKIESSTERVRLAGQIWGEEAARSMPNLIARGMTQIRADMDAATEHIVTGNRRIVDSCGAWDTAMKELRGTALSVWREGVLAFMPQITAAMQSLSATLAENRERVMGMFAAFGNVASVAVPALAGIFETAASLAAMIGSNRIAVYALLTTMGGFAAVMTAWKTSMVVYTAAVNAAKIATGLWTAAQWALNAAMTANPIGLVVAGIVAAIAAVAAAGYAIYKNWEPIKAFFAGLFERLKSGFLAVVGWVKRGFTAAWEWLKNSAVFKAISWIAEKVFGVGASLSAAAPAPGVPAAAAKLPISGEELTTMSRAAVSRSSTANTDARSFTTNASITINQQPGEDADALAERVSARLAESYSGALAAAI